MSLELFDSGSGDMVADVFYSDASRAMTVSIYRQPLPLDVVELL